LRPNDVPARLAALAVVDAERTVHVRADRDLPYGRVMDIVGSILPQVGVLAWLAHATPTELAAVEDAGIEIALGADEEAVERDEASKPTVETPAQPEPPPPSAPEPVIETPPPKKPPPPPAPKPEEEAVPPRPPSPAAAETATAQISAGGDRTGGRVRQDGGSTPNRDRRRTGFVASSRGIRAESDRGGSRRFDVLLRRPTPRVARTPQGVPPARGNDGSRARRCCVSPLTRRGAFRPAPLSGVPARNSSTTPSSI